MTAVLEAAIILTSDSTAAKRAETDLAKVEAQVKQTDQALGKLGGGGEVAGKKFATGMGHADRAAHGVGTRFDGTKSKADKLAEGIGAASDKFSGMGGPVGDVASQLGGLGGAAGIAGAAVGGMVAFIAGGVGKLTEMYDATRKFKDVAGTGWEDSSRLIAVMDDLRVNAETGASAIGKFTKELGTNPQALAAFGVEVVRAKDGSVDMIATLQSLADKFAATTDPTQRAALGSAAFGRSWQEIVPVLQQGGARLRQLMGDVKDYQIATAEGAKQQDEWFAAMDDMQDSVEGLQKSLAQEALPTLIDTVEQLTQLAEWANKVEGSIHPLANSLRMFSTAGKIELAADAMKRLGMSTAEAEVNAEAFGGEVETLGAGIGAAGLVIGTASKAVDTLSSSQKNAEQTAKDAGREYKEWEKATHDARIAQEKLRDAVRDLDGSALSLERAQIKAADASQELARKAYDAAVAEREHGRGSDEASQAAEGYRRSQLDAKQALIDSAQAAVDNGAKLAEQAGKALDATGKNQLYRDELARLKSGVSDPVLLAWLDNLIGKYDAMAASADWTRRKLQDMNNAIADSPLREVGGTAGTSGPRVRVMAAGGMAPKRAPFIAGEGGRPELIISRDDLHVFNGSQTQAILGGRGGARTGPQGGITVENLNVSATPGVSASRIAKDIYSALVREQRRQGGKLARI